jgi:hypothetical protein
MDDALRQRMRNAAKMAADAARQISGAFSVRIPAAISVFDDGTGIGVNVSGAVARNADPIEYGKRHPLFGNDKYWYKTPYHPFLLQAMDQVQDAATDEIGDVVFDWARDDGWTVEG